MAKVFIPSLLRELTGGVDQLELPGSTLRQIVNNLEAAYPGTRARLLSGDRINPTLGVVIDGITARRGLMEAVAEHSEVHFLPRISGGALR